MYYFLSPLFSPLSLLSFSTLSFDSEKCEGGRSSNLQNYGRERESEKREVVGKKIFLTLVRVHVKHAWKREAWEEGEEGDANVRERAWGGCAKIENVGIQRSERGGISSSSPVHAFARESKRGRCERDWNHLCHERDSEMERGGERKDEGREEAGQKVEVVQEKEEREDFMRERDKRFLPLMRGREVHKSLHVM